MLKSQNNAQGWNGKNPIFAELIHETLPLVIIEVGSWKGQSTITMAHACKEIGLINTKIYCVDTWLGAVEFYTNPTPERDLEKRDGYPQVYYTFLKNITEAGVKDMIEPIPLPSHMAWKILPKADLIYIDASHEYEDVKSDIENYRKLLKPNGIMFGDDYSNSIFPGVKKAVDEAGGEQRGWYWILKSGIM